MHALRLCDSEPPEAIVLFGLPLDVILQLIVTYKGRRAWVLGLRTPMGFAAVRMASEAILKVRDMVRTLRPVDHLFRTWW